MKKLLLTLVAAVAAFAVSAQITVNKTGVKIYGYDAMAMEIGSDGDPEYYNAWYDYSYEDEEIYVAIYDADFSLIKKIELKGYKNVESIDSYLEYKESLIATKNWLLKNDKWCVILSLPTGEFDEYGDPVTKPVVVDEDGKFISNVSDFAVVTDTDYMCFEYIPGQPTGGTPYAIICTSEENYEDNVLDVCTFSGSNSIKTVKVGTMSAYPNPLGKGQKLTVTLSRVADSSTFIVITDMSGRQITRKRIENGTDKVVLPQARFSHGQYIYTVIYGDGSSISDKLLAE